MRSPLFPAAAIVGVAAVLIGASSPVPPAQAATRITVPGAGPLYYPDLITSLPVGRFYMLGMAGENGDPLSVLEGYDELNLVIGEQWFPGTTPWVVKYPASIGVVSGSLSAPVVDDAVETGRADLDAKIRSALQSGDPVAIAALSEGTLVINRELAYLATDPTAPPKGSLSFVMFASPELGLANTYWPDGVTVPLIHYTAQSIADSQYDVSVVYSQYDFWANPPDRPWNLLSDVNTLFGMAYFHNATAAAVPPGGALPSNVVEVSRQTSELGGTTITYMVPASTLPMLKPLQQLGVPAPIVDALNSGLKPIVDAGYSNLTPDAGPHFSHGQLVGLPAPLASLADSERPRVMAQANSGTRVGSDPRRVLRHVVDGVTKRLKSLTGMGTKNKGPLGFSKPAGKLRGPGPGASEPDAA